MTEEKYRLSCSSVKTSGVEIEEICSESVDSLVQEFYNDFEVTIPCDKNERKVYPYEAVLEFISEGISICVKEINALKNNEMGTAPSRYYVEPRP